MGAFAGYARVSTEDQSLDLQRDALREAGCQRVFEDVSSGARTARPGLDEALAWLREGDTLVVWKLDRAGRSLPHLVRMVADLGARGVGFKSLTDPIDTTTAGGRLQFHVFAAFAQFERDTISERTRAGLAAARARGREGGRRPVVTADVLAGAEKLMAAGLTVREAAARLRIGKSALYDALKGSSDVRQT